MKMLAFLKKIWYTVNRRIHFEIVEEKTVNAIALADYVISAFEQEKATVTNLKLQKVLYYIQGYFFRYFGCPAFEEDIYGWQYGPVVPTVYYHFASCHASRLTAGSSGSALTVSDDAKKLIDTVVRRCSDLSTSTLVSKTHEEAPWRTAPIGGVISMASIKRYFSMNDPLGLAV